LSNTEINDEIVIKHIEKLKDNYKAAGTDDLHGVYIFKKGIGQAIALV